MDSNEEIEVEKKWLGTEYEGWKSSIVDKEHILQAYLENSLEKVVRIRIINGKEAIKTIKEKSTIDSNGFLARPEKNISFDLEEAKKIIQNSEQVIDKTRYSVLYEGLNFEIDVFNNLEQPLTLIELEIKTNEQLKIFKSIEESIKNGTPNWIGEEVTTDYNYSNNNLLKKTKRCKM